jgi:hypothetical protein
MLVLDKTFDLPGGPRNPNWPCQGAFGPSMVTSKVLGAQWVPNSLVQGVRGPPVEKFSANTGPTVRLGLDIIIIHKHPRMPSLRSQ